MLIIIGGDFNIILIKRNKISADFKDFANSFNFKTVIPEPKGCLTIRGLTEAYEIVESMLSYHTAQLFSCGSHYYMFKRDVSLENMNLFNNYISKLQFSDVYNAADPK